MHVRLNFDAGKKTKIYRHSRKERRKISEIAKFGWQIFGNTKNIACNVSQLFIYFYSARRKLPRLRRNRPYRLFTFTEWSRFRAKQLRSFSTSNVS